MASMRSGVRSPLTPPDGRHAKGPVAHAAGLVSFVSRRPARLKTETLLHLLKTKSGDAEELGGTGLVSGRPAERFGDEHTFEVVNAAAEVEVFAGKRRNARPPLRAKR